MSKARPRLPKGMEDLLEREWREVIAQAPLCDEDRYIATQYLIKGIPQIEIAAEMGNEFGIEYHRVTIHRRMPSILVKVERAARKLGMI